jgi:hypothetical protein
MQIERSHGRKGESREQESNPKKFGQAISVEKNKVGFDGWVILGDAKLIGPLSLVLSLLIRVPTSDLPK